MSLERQNRMQKVYSAMYESAVSMLSTAGLWAEKTRVGQWAAKKCVIDPEIKHLSGNPFVGSVSLFTRAQEILPTLKELTDQDPNGVCTCWLGTSRTFLITRPADLTRLMRFETHMKKPATENIAEVFDEKNTFNIPIDATWYQQHEIYDRNLHDVRRINDDISHIIDAHEQKLNAGETLELNKFFTDISIDVVAQLLLGTSSLANKIKGSSKTRLDVMHEAVEQVDQVILDVYENIKLQLKKLLHLSAPSSMINARELLRKVFKEYILKADREQVESTRSLYSDFAEEETDPAIEELAEKLKTDRALSVAAFLLFVGHETLAKAMSFCFRELIAHKEVAEKLKTELTESGRSEYLDCVVNETLRLHPPLPIYGRTVTADFDLKLEGSNKVLHFKKDDTILISPWITQRNNKIFADPEQFNPDRWANQKKPSAFMPFGRGMRSCPGLHMALAEIRWAIKILSNRLDLDSLPEHEMQGILNFKIKGTLQPVNPAHVRVRGR